MPPDKELLKHYGEEYQEEYEKTLEYQGDKLREALSECWKSTELEPYFHKIASWISKKLS